MESTGSLANEHTDNGNIVAQTARCLSREVVTVAPSVSRVRNSTSGHPHTQLAQHFHSSRVLVMTMFLSVASSLRDRAKRFLIRGIVLP